MPFLFPPVYAIKNELPPKPLIIAHRGGSHYAPENTLAAAYYTNLIEADGWEIDVQMSKDGIPFLFHDDDLMRTTNVEEIFPERKNSEASFFNSSELKMLNAGNWFVENDPYGKIKEDEISTELLEIYKNASIPTLEEALIYSKNKNLIVNVDFKTPPVTHPYYAQFFNICLSTIRKIEYDAKIWITAYNQSWLNLTEQTAPAIITAISITYSGYITAEEFLSTGYDMINTPHGWPDKIFKHYEEASIFLNTWTVDLSPRYQQLWILGVDSVTTNVPAELKEIKRPTLLIKRHYYILIWLLTEILGLGGVFFLRISKRLNFGDRKKLF